MSSDLVFLSYLFQELGATEKDVAHKLEYLHLTGERNNFWRCPIAKYVAKYLLDAGTYKYVTASSSDVAIWILENEVTYTPTTDAIFNFIISFDQGLYPELVE